jgi:hypothetical protein
MVVIIIEELSSRHASLLGRLFFHVTSLLGRLFFMSQLQVAYWLLQHKVSVMMAACDTFRSGAVEQLRTHARRLQVLNWYHILILMMLSGLFIQCLFLWFIPVRKLDVILFSLVRSLYLKRAMRKIQRLWQRKQFRRPHAMVLMLFLLILLVECRCFYELMLYHWDWVVPSGII